MRSISGTWIGCFVRRVILIYVPKEETPDRKTKATLPRKTTAKQNQKVE